MAALLVGLSMMAVLMSMALPVWSQFAKREREAELIWRGQQYARAIGLFQRKYANTFPPNVNILVEQRFLREKYKDPITNDDFQPIPAGGATPGQIGDPRDGARQGGSGQRNPTTGSNQTRLVPFRIGEPGQPGTSGFVIGQPGQPGIGIQGVVSKSTDESIKVYNGRTKYSEWAFVHVAAAQRITPPGTQQPNVPPGSQQRPGGGSTFSPASGIDRRPPSPFGPGQPPRQPSPFGPSPFGQPGQAPPRPPGGE